MQLRVNKDIYDILLVVPKSYTQRKSSTGCTFMSVVQQLLSQRNTLQSVFDAEEIDNILKLFSLQMGLDCYLHPRDLQGLLSVTFSCVVVDDELTHRLPFCEFDEGRAKNLGTVPNVLERLHSAVEIST